MIRFTCDCGKQLQAKAAFAGKATRCPECGEKVDIPDAEEDDRREAKGRIQSSPAKPKKGAMRDEDEEEDRPRKRRRDEEDEDEDTGRGSKGRVQSEPRSKKSASRDEEEDDRSRRRRRDEDDDEFDDRPQKKSKKKKQKSALVLIIIAIVGGVVLLGGGGFAAYWFLRGGSGEKDVAFIPPDAQGFVSLRVGEVANSEGVKKIIQKVGGSNPLEEIASDVGLTTAEVDRVTIVFHDPEASVPVGWVIVTTSKPYDQKKILDKLSSSRVVKHEGKSFHVGQHSSSKLGLPGARPAGGMPPPGKMPGGPGMGTAAAKSDTAIYFASKTVLVVAGGEGVMTQALTLAARKNPTGPLAEGISALGSSRQFVAAVALPAKAQQELKMQANAAGQFKVLASNLATLTAVTVAGSYDSKLAVDVTLRYPDDKQAGEAKKALDGLPTIVSLAAAQMPKELHATLSDFVNNLKIEQSGPNLIIKLEVSAQTIDNLMNQAMMGPPPAQPTRPGGQPTRPGGQPAKPGGQPKRPGGKVK